MNGTRTKALVRAGLRPKPRHLRDGHRSENRRGRVVTLEAMAISENDRLRAEGSKRVLSVKDILGYNSYTDTVIIRKEELS